MVETKVRGERKAGSQFRTGYEVPSAEVPPRSTWRWPVVLLLALLTGLLIVGHGCHGDEDTELLSRGFWVLF
jgi:hypothetical protein